MVGMRVDRRGVGLVVALLDVRGSAPTGPAPAVERCRRFNSHAPKRPTSSRSVTSHGARRACTSLVTLGRSRRVRPPPSPSPRPGNSPPPPTPASPGAGNLAAPPWRRGARCSARSSWRRVACSPRSAARGLEPGRAARRPTQRAPARLPRQGHRASPWTALSLSGETRHAHAKRLDGRRRASVSLP